MKQKLFFNEFDFEENIINKLKSLNWIYKSSEEIYELRYRDISKVILESVLKEYLIKKYNVSNEVFNKIWCKLNLIHQSSFEKSNIEFHNMLIEGIKVFDKKLKKTLTYKLIDEKEINNNIYIFTNQFLVRSSNPNFETQRPDIVFYINGLPIIVMELKSPKLDFEKIEEAYEQIKNYQKYIKPLFLYNFFNVISTYSETKIGSLTSKFDMYKVWRGKNFKSDSMEIFSDLFKHKTLLDVILNFTYWNTDDKKIVSMYHQYFGVKKLINSALKTNNKKGGIFWHVQGSGKTISMVFFVSRISKIKKNSTFIVVTDRNLLDDQSLKVFKEAEGYTRQKTRQIESIKDLKKELKNLNQDGIYFTTVQKFNEKVGKLIDRENVFVITDEAHRSHNNIDITYDVDIKSGIVKKKFGNAKYLRDAFPNAVFVGFTGTPIENDDKSTSKIFGKVVTKYLMLDAEKDGVIVPIRYESRKPELHFDKQELKNLDDLGIKWSKKILVKSKTPMEIRKKINKIVQKLENFILDDDRIRGIAKDFLNHYNQRKNLLEGKAMFVAFNRKIAHKYYNEILKLDPKLKNKMFLIVTNTNNQSDDSELIKLSGTSTYRRKKAVEFKDVKSNFKIAIVVDMWLTGFDIRSLDLMYIDKPMKMHNLIQAITRTNRVYTNNKNKEKTKKHGLIVDYVGIYKKLEEALVYYSGISKKEIIKNSDVSSLKPKYIEKLELVYKKFFNNDFKINFDKFSDDGNYRFQLLEEGTNKIIEKRKEEIFIKNAKNIKNDFKEILGSLTEKEKIKYQLIIIIRSHLIKLALSKIDFSDIKKELLNQLFKVIKYNKITSFDKIQGKEIKLSQIINFVLLKNKFNEKNKFLKIKEKTSAFFKIIEEMKSINIETSRKLSCKLKELLNKYDSNYITLQNLEEGLFKLAYEAKEKSDINKKNEMGYDKKEQAFFNILLTPLKDRTKWDNSKIKEILDELLKIINDKKRVNEQWIYNDAMQDDVIADMIILLDKYNYPPKDQKITSDTICKQIIYQNNYRDGEK